MKNYIQENSNNYDVIFFHHIRSSQFLPKNYYGKTILDREIYTLIIIPKHQSI